jgi:membrane protein implicated in regulation of membrane protease activity
MGEAFTNLSGTEAVFLACAAFGSILFIVKFALQLFGAHGGGDVEIDVGNADVIHADADASFKLLSLQGLTAFFTMFGLVGFALSRGSGTGEAVAFAGAFAAGVATTWLIGKIFSFPMRLQSSGTLDNSRALMEVGTVYLTIPAAGVGKVQVPIAGRLREFEAVAAGNEELKTGTSVRVLQVNGSTLVVEKAQFV